jgi:hypothetical protein
MSNDLFFEEKKARISKVLLRLPSCYKDRAAICAYTEHRSLHAELVMRIINSFSIEDIPEEAKTSQGSLSPHEKKILALIRELDLRKQYALMQLLEKAK